jgi:hypothetical protein
MLVYVMSDGRLFALETFRMAAMLLAGVAICGFLTLLFNV